MTGSYQKIVDSLAPHLRPFVEEQHYERYTPQQQAVWRYIMRKNLKVLAKYAHPVYLQGLKQTGISIEHIPDIDEMNVALGKIGWRAVVVSGFIPPAAFMEFQANKTLVISAEMRSVEHILYTPAPDIVHEAAGHAPIIGDIEYADYLQKFGEYGCKAIASKADHEVYEAIRELSIIKEYPHATKQQIAEAEKDLQEKIDNNTHLTEAALLSRLHWWTVEYGLVGTPDNYTQYGAGLLSSVGESQACLRPEVKKLPLTVDCVNYNYDITSMQPQLFVCTGCAQLMEVLEEFADTMAFRRGGAYGLQAAVESENVATVELSSGLQVSGVVSEMIIGENGWPVYVKTAGPTALAGGNKQLPGHGRAYHKDGFGSPVGRITGLPVAPEKATDEELALAGIRRGEAVDLRFESGIGVSGTLNGEVRNNGMLQLLSFTDCRVTGPQGELLFDPAWGTYDMAVGESIPSVFGGPADRAAFEPVVHKSEKKAIDLTYSKEETHLFELYSVVRHAREKGPVQFDTLKKIHNDLSAHFPEDWLLRVELLELALDAGEDAFGATLRAELQGLRQKSEEYDMLIGAGIELAGYRTSELMQEMED